ncbi:MAG: helix-turn-helix transcriptional regulator [Planctomycetes bacterium]|nr:helix-turn-helix transcriptional regulator [Planctomycetota bacterium]
MAATNPTVGGTDAEVMRSAGQRLAALRKSQQLTMVEVAARTGLTRQTIAAAERGSNPTLLTLVRLLRAYGRLDALQQFVPPPELSPMALLGPTKRGPRG